jgi:hypothetical protein
MSIPDEARSKSGIVWIDTAKNAYEDDDLKDAINFISLIKKPRKAKKLIARLVKKDLVTFKAKDILRAAKLQPLPPDDVDVIRKLDAIKAGTPIPPVFLLRGNSAANRPLLIADGYHRVSAAFALDPTTDVQAQIIHP